MILAGHDLLLDLQHIVLLFLPYETFMAVSHVPKIGFTLTSEINNGFCNTQLYENGIPKTQQTFPLSSSDRKSVKKAVCMGVFMVLQIETGQTPPWGTLTGIRPSKVVHQFWEKGFSNEQITHTLQTEFLVHPKKIALAMSVANAEKPFLAENNPKQLALYVGVPFCPSRCSYCSFAVNPLPQFKAYVEDYTQKLCEELAFIANMTKGYVWESIYIGGGTPTALEEAQLDQLLKTIATLFLHQTTKEFTVEAGRPDSITHKKLQLLKTYGVSRLSINPQTMNEKTLREIGRNHSVTEFLTAYEQAVSLGFSNINVDTILGLPNETTQDVFHTFSEIKKLSPQSVTVHGLAIKKGSLLKEKWSNKQLEHEQNTNHPFPHTQTLEQMLTISQQACEEMGLFPYYMYRQKNMVGHLENVGYAKPGLESVYNIQMMEERQAIFGAGTAAVTKLPNQKTGHTDRFFNVKNVVDYCNRFGQVLERKTLLPWGN